MKRCMKKRCSYQSFSKSFHAGEVLRSTYWGPAVKSYHTLHLLSKIWTKWNLWFILDICFNYEATRDDEKRPSCSVKRKCTHKIILRKEIEDGLYTFEIRKKSKRTHLTSSNATKRKSTFPLEMRPVAKDSENKVLPIFCIWNSVVFGTLNVYLDFINTYETRCVLIRLKKFEQRTIGNTHR